MTATVHVIATIVQSTGVHVNSTSYVISDFVFPSDFGNSLTSVEFASGFYGKIDEVHIFTLKF